MNDQETIRKFITDNYKTMTAERMADVLNLSDRQIRNIMKELGLRKRANKATEEQIKEMIKLYNNGVPYRLIGKALGFNHGTIRNYISKWKNRKKQIEQDSMKLR